MVRVNAKLTVVFLLTVAAWFVCSARNVDIKASVDDKNHVHLSIGIPRSVGALWCTVYRSHVDLQYMNALYMNEMPITKIELPLTGERTEYLDTLLAINCTYYYYIQAVAGNGKLISSEVQSVALANCMVPDYPAKRLSLFIDKLNYFLELRYDGITVKRYPIGLGTLPHHRKLCTDRQSTPEGVYRIEYLRPKATFYRAIGVSYPNKVDYKRYYAAKKTHQLASPGEAFPSIGGSIQIHGGGVEANWTWGCIALRNDDIDEIFSLAALKIGCPIYIVGREVTRENVAAENPANL